MFLTLNFLLQTILCFAAEIANNHGSSSLKQLARVLFLSRSLHGKPPRGPQPGSLRSCSGEFTSPSPPRPGCFWAKSAESLENIRVEFLESAKNCKRVRK